MSYELGCKLYFLRVKIISEANFQLWSLHPAGEWEAVAICLHHKQSDIKEQCRFKQIKLFIVMKPQDLPATETLHTVAWEEINQSFNQRILHPSMLNLERYKSQLSEPKRTEMTKRYSCSVWRAMGSCNILGTLTLWLGPEKLEHRTLEPAPHPFANFAYSDHRLILWGQCDQLVLVQKCQMGFNLQLNLIWKLPECFK